MTLHNNARFLPAIQLKERVLAERAWEEDGTGGRTFLNQLISRERGYTGQPFGRPQPQVPPPQPGPRETDENPKDESKSS
jgi:hypothetical protein